MPTEPATEGQPVADPVRRQALRRATREHHPNGLYAGGDIRPGVNIAQVRLTLADGTQLSDDGRGGVALFLSLHGSEPATVTFLTTKEAWSQAARPPDRSPDGNSSSTNGGQVSAAASTYSTQENRWHGLEAGAHEAEGALRLRGRLSYERVRMALLGGVCHAWCERRCGYLPSRSRWLSAARSRGAAVRVRRPHPDPSAGRLEPPVHRSRRSGLCARRRWC